MDEHPIIHKLKHFLPTQAPLKDFIHHNTLHAFQDKPFHEALQTASENFGYRVYQPLSAYRNMYEMGKIDENILARIIAERGHENKKIWFEKLLNRANDETIVQQVGMLRDKWKSDYKINLDKNVHPTLFRLIGHYIDQGIAIEAFPETKEGFLKSIIALDHFSYKSIFKSKRVKTLCAQKDLTLNQLLMLVVGPEEQHERYLFDQQFAHPGWSGMVAFLDENPSSLFDPRPITLQDFIIVELLLEIDFLDTHFGDTWKPIGFCDTSLFAPLMSKTNNSDLFHVLSIWQDAYEWSYYASVIDGLNIPISLNAKPEKPSFQAIFCIDDRTAAFRAHLEAAAPQCGTFGTAGFFSAEFYFEPEFGKFNTKVCPAPVTPQYLIQEKESSKRHKKDAHFSKQSQGFFAGWLLSQTMGFWSAVKLSVGIFMPMESKASVSSFKHMDPKGKLSIVHKESHAKHNGLQVGYTNVEMANRVESMLRSIGLTSNFADLIYVVGHGASSTNNTHYAGYDCGACSGRPGSVNARVMAFMANRLEVRNLLAERGLILPDTTRFVGGLHDTSRDEVEFYDLETLSKSQHKQHETNVAQFNTALSTNAAERAERFMLINSAAPIYKIHKQVKLRSISLFEPRPEWNHATNALCVVGRRETQRHFDFHRRAFLNSYNYTMDMDGHFLLGILNAVAPVCGGINLEYYFSKSDNSRLGAGSKLPHNVMGLIGVANGMDGDLRPGLPLQMVNIHEAVRLLVVVEHLPEIVMQTIVKNASTFEWFKNEWVRLAVINPENRKVSILQNGEMIPYTSHNTGVTRSSLKKELNHQLN